MRSRHSAVEVALLLLAGALLAVTLVAVLGPRVTAALSVQFPTTEQVTQ